MPMEKDMIQPETGPQYRDIIEIARIPDNRWYFMVTLRCGHKKRMTKKSYHKWHTNSCTLCHECVK